MPAPGVALRNWLCNSGGRHQGLGQPLASGSWLHRPYSLGVFVGVQTGNELAENLVEQEAAPIYGVRLGWDVGDYWGLETRFAFADPHLHDFATGQDLDRGDNTYWDGSLLCYPWGESRLRPYAAVGLGLAKFDFSDAAGGQYSDDVLSLPISLGLKYRCTSQLAARFDVTDTITLGGDTVGTLHSVAFTLGLEYRFGAVRTTYWPWDVDHTW